MENITEVLDKLKNFLESNTVTGKPILVNETTTVIPLTKIMFGMGTAVFGQKDAIGLGGSVEPIGFLAVSGDKVTFITTTDKSALSTRIVDLAEHIANKIIPDKTTDDSAPIE